MCEANKYTLSIYGICADCPEGGECVGGIVKPKNGLFLMNILF